MNRSICGMTLNAISLVNCSGLFGSCTKIALVWANSSSIASLPGAGDRLVSGDHHTLDLPLVVQRLQRHHHLDGRAIRIGDDPALGELPQVVRVHLRHHQRHVGVHAELAGVVDHHAAGLGCARRMHGRHRRAGREQPDVPAREVERVEVLHLEHRLLAERDLRAGRAAGSDARPPRRPGTCVRRVPSAFRARLLLWRRRPRPGSPCPSLLLDEVRHLAMAAAADKGFPTTAGMAGLRAGRKDQAGDHAGVRIGSRAASGIWRTSTPSARDARRLPLDGLRCRETMLVHLAGCPARADQRCQTSSCASTAVWTITSFAAGSTKIHCPCWRRRISFPVARYGD